LTDERYSDQLVKSFNNYDNFFIILTSKSNTGLDLAGVHFMFIQDEVWNWSEITQIYGRGARLNSHEGSLIKNYWIVIPCLVRNALYKGTFYLVRDWRFFNNNPNQHDNDEVPTVDIIMYQSILNKKIGSDMADHLLKVWSEYPLF
jgi:hypothetical protein